MSPRFLHGGALFGICCLFLTACAATQTQIRAASEEVQLYRKLDETLNIFTQDPSKELEAAVIAEQFSGRMTQANVPPHRAAEIQFQVVRSNARKIRNAELLRHRLAEIVFRNDPVGFLLAVGYGTMVDLSSPAEKALYSDIVEHLKPLATRNAGTFSATYQEKADLALVLTDSLKRGGFSTQKMLMVFRLALNDIFGQTSLYQPQVQMVLRLAFFQQGTNTENGQPSYDASLDGAVAREIEFVETLALLQSRGWDDRSAVMRVLDHYFGNLSDAIEFALVHGWGADSNEPVDNARAIGRILSDYDLVEILQTFAGTRWASPDFSPRDPLSYGGTNALVFELLFPPESPQRYADFPVPDLAYGKPEKLRPGAQLFSQLKAYFGSWEDVIRVVQAGDAGLEPQLIASLIYLQGAGLGWGQMMLDADVDIGHVVRSADTVFGAGAGFREFLTTTQWRSLKPVEQLVRLAEALGGDCLEGFELLTPMLGKALEQASDRNRIYIADGWRSMPRSVACDKPGGGRQLFMETFMVEWSGGSPLAAVTNLSRALKQPRDEVFEYLSESQFAGLTKAEFTRKYVVEDIDARRALLDEMSSGQ